MLKRNNVLTAITASTIAAAAIFGATGPAAAASAYHKPTICIFLPLCESPPPIKPEPKKPHHHHAKKVVKSKPS